MLQKLACRMGMGESGHQKPQIPARPRWPVDAVSYCTSVDSSLMQALKVVLNGYTIRSSIVGTRIDLEEDLSFAAEG